MAECGSSAVKIIEMDLLRVMRYTTEYPNCSSLCLFLFVSAIKSALALTNYVFNVLCNLSMK